MVNPEIKVTLINEELWHKFAPENEMIISKKGRRLFPFLDYKIEGLSPDGLYSVEVQMERIGNKKYKFNHGKWHEDGDATARKTSSVEELSTEYKRGADVMQSNVSFLELKITNKLQENMLPLTIVLKTLHRYMPILVIKELDKTTNDAVVVSKTSFTFTSFFAVSLYQNKKVTQLKKELNKYAFGYLTKAEKEKKRKSYPKRSRADSDDGKSGKRGPQKKKACNQVASLLTNSISAISNENIDLKACNQVSPLPNSIDVMSRDKNENIDPFAYQPNFDSILSSPNSNNSIIPLLENEQSFDVQYQSFNTSLSYLSYYQYNDTSFNFQTNNFNFYHYQFFDNFEPFPQPAPLQATQCPNSYETSPSSSYISL